MKNNPIHPGVIINEEYLKPLSLTITELSAILGVSRKTVSKIINERGAVTPDMALRLSRAFDTSPELWLNLQKTFELWQAAHTSKKWKSVQPVSGQMLNANL